MTNHLNLTEQDRLIAAMILTRNLSRRGTVGLNPEGLNKTLNHLVFGLETTDKTNHPHNISEELLFPVAAFIDETILNSTMVIHSEWLPYSWQRSFFVTTTAGEEFFSRLTEFLNQCDPGPGYLQKNNEKQEQYSNRLMTSDIAKAEIYLAALELGFRGRHFSNSDNSILTEYKERLLRLLGHSSQTTENIFISGADLLTPIKSKKILFPGKILKALIFIFLPLAITIALVWQHHQNLSIFINNWTQALSSF